MAAKNFVPWKSLFPALDLLNQSEVSSSIFIDKLVYIGEGGTMSEYHITQKGKNLVAVVDSFKIVASDVGAELGEDTSKALSAFLSAVSSSDLSDDDKKNALEVATEVVEKVKNQRQLLGRAKIVWQGLKSVIVSVPKAVEAWEKLTQLWS